MTTRQHRLIQSVLRIDAKLVDIFSQIPNGLTVDAKFNEIHPLKQFHINILFKQHQAILNGMSSHTHKKYGLLRTQDSLRIHGLRYFTRHASLVRR